MRSKGLSAIFASCLVAAAGCDSSATVGTGACATGSVRACTCLEGQSGTQSCSAQTGRYDGCRCVPDAGGGCGDGVCESGENCQICPDDCGACPACNFAPSCTDAVGVPSMPTARPDLDIPPGPPPAPPDGGVEGARNCGPAQLRLRVEKIRTHKGGGKIYCIVTATDGTHSEVAITPKTSDLGNDMEFYFDPGVGEFWGQKDLEKTTNNLAITYNCALVKSDAWASVFKAAGDAAMQAGGIAGPYGWAFGIAGVGADVAAAAIKASSGDDLKFNAQQVIDKSDLLDLTNGRTWTIEKGDPGGLFGIGAWDWTLTIESWGCAEAKPFPM